MPPLPHPMTMGALLCQKEIMASGKSFFGA
jgi:hypothetical protein